MNYETILIFTLVLICNSVISIVVIMRMAHFSAHIHRCFFYYAIAYFVFVILAFTSFLTRQYLPLELSVFLTNYFSTLTPCAILFSIKFRYGNTHHLWRSKWMIYALLVASLQAFLAHFAPEKIELRSIVIYTNVVIVYIVALNAMTTSKSKFFDTGMRIFFAGVVLLTVLSFLIPIVYVGFNGPSQQILIILAIQIIAMHSVTCGILCSLGSSELR